MDSFRSRTDATHEVEGTSWLSLLASSSLGDADVSTTRTEIRATNAKLGRGPMRLVVQTFSEKTPGPSARPLSSSQQRVTAEELRRGVHVNVTAVGGASRQSHVMAWVERGAPDLEFDGHRSRPGRDSLVGGAVRPSEGRVRINLHGDLRTSRAA